MLRLIKKHLSACKKTSEKDWKCIAKDGKSKVACPFYIVGPDPRNPTGPRIKHHTGTSSEQIARVKLVEFESDLFNPKPEPQPEPEKTTLEQALEFYIGTKKHKSADSDARRSAFRTDVDHDSEVMPIGIPNGSRSVLRP